MLLNICVQAALISLTTLGHSTRRTGLLLTAVLLLAGQSGLALSSSSDASGNINNDTDSKTSDKLNTRADTAPVTATVRGSSMAPSYQSNDTIELRPLTGETAIPNGQAVIVRFNSRAARMLKRVYASPGDKLELNAGKLVINGRAVTPVGWPDNYRLDDKKSVALRAQLRHYQNTLPPDKYVLLGDNPLNSFDSLDFGLVDRKQIEALASE